jgi:hypothetical protein
VVDFLWFRLVCKLWMNDSRTKKHCEHGECVIDPASTLTRGSC